MLGGATVGKRQRTAWLIAVAVIVAVALVWLVDFTLGSSREAHEWRRTVKTIPAKPDHQKPANAGSHSTQQPEVRAQGPREAPVQPTADPSAPSHPQLTVVMELPVGMGEAALPPLPSVEFGALAEGRPATIGSRWDAELRPAAAVAPVVGDPVLEYTAELATRLTVISVSGAGWLTMFAVVAVSPDEDDRLIAAMGRDGLLVPSWFQSSEPPLEELHKGVLLAKAGALAGRRLRIPLVPLTELVAEDSFPDLPDLPITEAITLRVGLPEDMGVMPQWFRHESRSPVSLPGFTRIVPLAASVSAYKPGRKADQHGMSFRFTPPQFVTAGHPRHPLRYEPEAIRRCSMDVIDADGRRVPRADIRLASHHHRPLDARLNPFGIFEFAVPERWIAQGESIHVWSPGCAQALVELGDFPASGMHLLVRLGPPNRIMSVKVVFPEGVSPAGQDVVIGYSPQFQPPEFRGWADQIPLPPSGIIDIWTDGTLGFVPRPSSKRFYFEGDAPRHDQASRTTHWTFRALFSCRMVVRLGDSGEFAWARDTDISLHAFPLDAAAPPPRGDAYSLDPAQKANPTVIRFGESVALEASLGPWIVVCEQVTTDGMLVGSARVEFTRDVTDAEATVYAATSTLWKLLKIADETGHCTGWDVAFFRPITGAGALSEAILACRSNLARLPVTPSLSAIGQTGAKHLGVEVFCSHAATKVVIPSDWTGGVYCVAPANMGIFAVHTDFKAGVARVTRPPDFGGVRLSIASGTWQGFVGAKVAVWPTTSDAAPNPASEPLWLFPILNGGEWQIPSLPPGRYAARLVINGYPNRDLQFPPNPPRVVQLLALVSFVIEPNVVADVTIPTVR